MLRRFMVLGLVLAQVAQAFAQTGAQPPNPDPMRDWSRDPRERRWDQPSIPETQEQARERWDREHRNRYDPRPNPTYKPGSEPPRQQQQPNFFNNPDSSPGPYRSR